LRGASALVGLALLAGCAAAPPVAAPAAAPASAAPDPAPIKPEPLPVTPVPVPPIVVVQSAPPTPPPQQAAPAPQVSDEELQALGLLAELQRYVVEAGEDLKRELAAANAALARTRSDANRIRVAMLLTLPAAGPPDDARALSLLDPIVGKTGNASAMKQIAALLYAQITERSRTVREEQRRTASAQEKLDALRAVERTLLLERGRNAGGGAGGGGGGTGR
jgi:2-oxoglutarate dehydrogenase E2 component (dihydrolipoamide succinyltransferase)